MSSSLYPNHSRAHRQKGRAVVRSLRSSPLSTSASSLELLQRTALEQLTRLCSSVDTTLSAIRPPPPIHTSVLRSVSTIGEKYHHRQQQQRLLDSNRFDTDIDNYST
ncbi:hypothetical protein PoB_001297600 [Plakobranchus ocellatus]|uniref:Uncharacterized protein n=1 Tax=Plakobranchus ocellatus TaxID=259542 RepID=A0AAV3YVR2_9GAST|nr:hypothetical protein PoB_001297600 [Plakobranchus ocellatus]